MNIKLTDEQRVPIKNPRDVFKIMRQILMQDEKIDREKEHFWVMGLMADSLIHYVELVSLGTMTATLVHPREVFRLAIQKGTVSLVLVHNHPSGNLMWSEADLDVTKQLFQVGRIHEIAVQDHLIITTKDYISMREEKAWHKIEADLKYKPPYIIEYEAKLEEKRQMAREMKNDGIEISRIAKISGLTEAEIEKL